MNEWYGSFLEFLILTVIAPTVALYKNQSAGFVAQYYFRRPSIMADYMGCGCQGVPHNSSCYLIKLPHVSDPQYLRKLALRNLHLKKYNGLIKTPGESTEQRINSLRGIEIICQFSAEIFESLTKFRVSANEVLKLYQQAENRTMFGWYLLLKLFPEDELKKGAQIYSERTAADSVFAKSGERYLDSEKIELVKRLCFIFYPVTQDEQWDLMLSQINYALNCLIE